MITVQWSQLLQTEADESEAMTSIALDFTDLKVNKGLLSRYSKFYNSKDFKKDEPECALANPEESLGVS